MIRILAVFCALTVNFGLVEAALGNDDIFTVARVKVDATGESAAVARETALSEGRVRAARLLLQRLTPEESWTYLPAFRTRDLIDIVSGIEITNEKTSSTRYLADVTYSFKPDRIRQALSESRIAFTETRSRLAVVLPIYETVDGPLLWEDENLWADVWKSRRLTHELVPLIAPLGELEDLVSVGTQDALAGEWSRLGPFAQRYNVSDVVIAYGRLQNNAEAEELVVRLTRLNGRSDGLSATVGERVDVVVRNSQNLPLEELMNFAIDQAVQRLQSRWKSQTIISSNAIANNLFATVRFSEHTEWLTLRKRLSALPIIRDFEILSLSMQGADVAIQHVGSLTQLGFALSQQDIQLAQTDVSTIILLGLDSELVPLSGEVSFEDYDYQSPETRDDVEIIEMEDLSMPSVDGAFANDPSDGESGEILVDIPLE